MAAATAVPKIEVMITSPERVVFNGTAQSVLLPGEAGTFEVLPLHRPLVSRVGTGNVVIDGRVLPIHRGVVRVAEDQVIAVVELPS